MASIFDVLLNDTVGDVHVWALPNIRGEGRERWLGTRSEGRIAAFVKKHDVAGYGVFYAVSTIRQYCPRKKQFAEELKFLFGDIDCKDIDLDPAEILRRLLGLPCPPSRIHATGNGFHVIWLLSRPVRHDGMEEAENLLRRIARHLAGDPTVAHSVALLRVPGTHNSKRGEWRPVTVVKEGNERYELGQIDAWLSSAREPVMVRKDKPKDKNPFLQLYEDMGYEAPVNVKERLANMKVGGAGDDAVHRTLLSVSGALTAAGVSEDDVVTMLLDRTQQLAGTENWNWRREERKIRRMIRDMRPKIEARKRRSQSLSAATVSDDDDDANVTASLSDASDKIGHNSKDEIPLHLRIADVYVAWIPTVDKDLKWVPGLRNDRHFWKCEDGIWTPLPTDSDVMKWMENDHRNILEGIGNRKKTKSTLFSEAARCVMRSQSVQEVGRIEWNDHGKIPTRSGLIDPVTFEIEPLKPEHHATWRIDAEYDPAARCPKWDQTLHDFFADQSEEDRKTNIELLQELAGMGLIDDKPKSLRKGLILWGPSDSGKSTILNVLAGLISDNPIPTTFKEIEKPHGTWPFIERAPWLLHEAFDQTDWHPSTTVKSLISGDVVSINPKGGRPLWAIYDGPIFWGTNHPPQFKETSAAMRNRLIIIRTDKVFDAENPVGVAAEAKARGYAEPSDMVLDTERSGLLTWALAGLKRAMARGYFVNTAAGVEALDEVEGASNQVKKFIRECVTFDCTKMISTFDFHAAFAAWWLDEVSADVTKVPDGQKVGSWLKSANHPLVAMDRDKLRDREGVRYYVGVVLNERGKALWQEAFGYGDGVPISAKISHHASHVQRGIPEGWLNHPSVVNVRLRTTRAGS